MEIILEATQMTQSLLPIDPGLAKLFAFDSKALEANRAGKLHPEQYRFLLLSPHFQSLFNLVVALTALAYLTWSWSQAKATGLVGPLALLLLLISSVNTVRQARVWLRFKRDVPSISLEKTLGTLKLEELSKAKARTRSARKMQVSSEEFLIPKGVHQGLLPARGQKMCLYWCREPVHGRKQILSAEFVN